MGRSVERFDEIGLLYFHRQLVTAPDCAHLRWLEFLEVKQFTHRGVIAPLYDIGVGKCCNLMKLETTVFSTLLYFTNGTKKKLQQGKPRQNAQSGQPDITSANCYVERNHSQRPDSIIMPRDLFQSFAGSHEETHT